MPWRALQNLRGPSPRYVPPAVTINARIQIRKSWTLTALSNAHPGPAVCAAVPRRRHHRLRASSRRPLLWPSAQTRTGLQARVCVAAIEKDVEQTGAPTPGMNPSASIHRESQSIPTRQTVSPDSPHGQGHSGEGQGRQNAPFPPTKPRSRGSRQHALQPPGSYNSEHHFQSTPQENLRDAAWS